MGKNLIQQRRGKGSPRYKVPSFRFAGEARLPLQKQDIITAKVIALYRDAIHSAPLADVVYDDNTRGLLIAPEGLRIGHTLKIGSNVDLEIGNTLPLLNIPEGSLVFNIEKLPGDGGKFVRSSGTFARVLAKTSEGVVVELPSKRKKIFNPKCRAMIGVVAGGGRLDKPLVKAGKAFHIYKSKNKLYPKVRGVAMNAVDHPHGGTRSSHLGRPTIAPKNAPPGRKVGKIRPKRTGKR